MALFRTVTVASMSLIAEESSSEGSRALNSAPPSNARKPIREPRKVGCPGEVSCSHCQKLENVSYSHCQKPGSASRTHCQKTENASYNRRHKSESMGLHPVARSHARRRRADGRRKGRRNCGGF